MPIIVNDIGYRSGVDVGTIYADYTHIYVYDGTNWISAVSTSEELNRIDNYTHICGPKIPKCLKSINKDSDLDELYVEQIVQKAKRDRFLFLDCCMYDTYNNSINIKYLEWCKRGNVPYLVAYRGLIGYSIYLEVNPRNVYSNRIFKDSIHNYIIKMGKGYTWSGTKEIYTLSEIPLDLLNDKLLSIVNLFRDSDNFYVE